MINKTRLDMDLKAALPIGGVSGPFAEQHELAPGCFATWPVRPEGIIRVDWPAAPTQEQQTQADAIVTAFDASPEADAAAVVADAKVTAKATAVSATDPFAVLNRAADRLTMQFVGTLFGWLNGEVIPYLNLLRSRENPPLTPLPLLPTVTWPDLIPAHAAMIDAETDPTQAITPE